MDKIKIVYIIGQLDKGGAEKQLYELVKGLNSEKYNPLVVCLNQGGYWCGALRSLNVKVIDIKRGNKGNVTTLLPLIKLLNMLKPDIVHTYMFSAGLYGRIAAIINGVPVILASERSVPEFGKDKNMSQLCIDKLLSLFSHGIICNTNSARDVLAKRYSFKTNKIFTVHNGINKPNYLENSKKKDLGDEGNSTQKVVGTVGGLYPQKNHRLFLDVAKVVLENMNNKDIKFLIIGDGILSEELEKYSKYLGIDKEVVFTGERHDVTDMLSSIDIFVMTSLYEGLSNAIMEAMLSGLPVVVTNVGGNKELIIDGETGFLCPQNKVEPIADKVIYLINNKVDAKRMGENGRKRIINEFGLEKMIKKTENIYCTLLRKKCISRT